MTFLHPTARRAQVSFFTNYLFSAVITRTHHLPTHTPFFRPIMSKKRALHFFLQITFFSSLLPFLSPEKLRNHLFRQIYHQKKFKSSLNEKKKFPFFFIIYFTFSLSPFRKKTKPLTFSALFIIGNKKTARENVPSKIFLFLFFFFFLLFCILRSSQSEKLPRNLFF